MNATLPANLPSVAKATLPAIYQGARESLEKCARIDECAEWADKAAALASYAKQAGDDTLQKMAERIRARAVRRCGELLKKWEPIAGHRVDLEPRVPGNPRSRREAAMDAKMSGGEYKTAMRVARIPERDFEAAVESDDPPTVTRMLEERKPKPLVDLEGRDPRDYAAATQALGLLRRVAEFTDAHAPEVIARGASAKERTVMGKQVAGIMTWLRALAKEMA